jgi:hypothetical protein
MTTKPAIILAASIILHAHGTFASDNPLQVQWRIVPHDSDYAFRCLAINTANTAVALQGVRQAHKDTDEKTAVISSLDDPRRTFHFDGISEDTDWPSPLIEIKARGSFVNNISKREFVAQRDNLIVGHYVEAHWFYGLYSNPLTFAFPKPDGSIALPVVESGFGNRPVVESGKLISRPIEKSHGQVVLAFVFNHNNTNEIGFLFLNGSKETVTVEKPLTQASRIIASAPAIEYKRELFVAGQPSENIEIEAGKVGEWRIPWQKVYDLISESDLAKIIVAGGNLDLVWKFGEYESTPLPITLNKIDVE